MAIQSFSVGQVLTAAQVNALQENDYNQTVSNKTASYTLVAADKGTRIAISSTSATTITVNTSLFSAGDTVFIQNLNTGVSTITAGTATVTTSSSLALAQWEGGTLYFTSTSAAIFFKSHVTPPASGGMTLLSTTTLSGATTSISISGTGYNYLQIYVNDVDVSGQAEVRFYCNSTQNNVDYVQQIHVPGTNYLDGLTDANARLTNDELNSTFGDSTWTITIYNTQSTTAPKNFTAVGGYYDRLSRRTAITTDGLIKDDAVISNITFVASSNTFSGGEVLIYGVK